MNIKKQLKQSWHQHEISPTPKYKDQLSFSQKKRYRVPLPVYLGTVVAALLVVAITIPVTIYITKNTNDAKIDFLAQSAQAKYNPNFGIVSYNEPYFNTSYLGNVRYGINEIDKQVFSRFINALNIKLSNKRLTNEELELALANAPIVTALYGNDYYDFYFTEQDLLVIGCNNLYYVYDLPNANLLFADFTAR